MSLTDRVSSVLIGLSARVGSSTPALVNEEAQLNNEGWDTLVQIWSFRVSALSAETLASNFPIGGRLGSRNWWVVGSVPQERGPGFWTATVTYKGWAQIKPAVVKVAASADSQTAENVGISGTTYAKVETHQPTPNLVFSYLVANVATAPKTSLVGTAQSPPVSIAVPSNVWASLDPYLYHFPNGWVLLESAEDRLPGTSAAYVTDTYKYIQAGTPG